MPTLQSHTQLVPIPFRDCQATQAKRASQSLSISVSFPTRGRKRKKHDGTTMAIRNASLSADMKVITLNKLFGRRTVKCLEIPHYAYTRPLWPIKKLP